MLTFSSLLNNNVETKAYLDLGRTLEGTIATEIGVRLISNFRVPHFVGSYCLISLF